MKNLIYAVLLFATQLLSAQTTLKEQFLSELPELEITDGVNLHIVSPEPIQYVDLSTNQLTGDLPSANIGRIKLTDDTKDTVKERLKAASHLSNGENIGIITVVGQSFIAQYRVVYRHPDNPNIVSNIQIQPEDMQPIELNKTRFSNLELSKLSMDIIRKQSDEKPIRKENNLKLKMQLNNVFVLSDYIFMDMTFINSTHLSYDIEDLKFTIEDKSIHKTTNNQSIELTPVFQLHPQKSFRKNFRNIYVFKKFTFPNSKVMKIRLIEEQLSGRTIEMKVNYSDILKADTF